MNFNGMNDLFISKLYYNYLDGVYLGVMMCEVDEYSKK